MPIKTGATVRQVVPTITGEVVERRFNESQDQMEYLVAYAGTDGEPGSRWFLESDLQEEQK